jgi:hypothetical protein
MPDLSLPPVPLISPQRARDIARGHMALAEQYHVAGMIDRALDANREARTWLAYSSALSATGSEPDWHGAP